MKTREFFIAGVLFFCVSGISLKLFSQDVDSIIVRHTDNKGVVNIDSLVFEGRKYVYTEPGKAYEIAEKTVKIAEKQKDRMQLANGYRFKGACFTQVKVDFDSAFHYLEQAENLYQSINTKEATIGEASVNHNFGTIKQIQGDYVEAINYYLQASKLFDEANDAKLRAYTLNNIATLYELAKDYSKAEKYARECIEVAQNAEDEFMVATGKIVLASVLMEQDKYEEIPSLLTAVLEYGEKNNDPYKVFLYHLNYGNYLMNYKKDNARAVKEYEKAQQFASQLGDEWEIMRNNLSLSEAYLENQQYDEAGKVADEALKTAIKLQAKDKQRESLWVLGQYNAHKLDFETAFKQINAAYLLQDTVFNESNQRHLAFVEAEYQAEKKEIRINSLEKERILYSIIFGVSLLGIIILLGALYLRQRAKKQLAQQQVIQLEKEKQLIATHAILEGEATERTRLARDLHDGLGGMLSAVKLNLFDMKKGGVVLASEDISRFNKVVEMLDSSITELRRVAHNMMPDSLSRYGLKVSLQDFCDSFSNVHFHFFGNDERLDNTLEIMIYRSVHELVNNALKYSEAENINVQIVQEDDRVSLTVQDDGKGFDVQQKVKGTGLNNIRTRAESVGGSLEVYSESGKGTEINVEFKIVADALKT